jgi:hypothetical protein
VTDIGTSRLAWRPATLANAAGHSWFTATHLAVAVSIAAVVVTIMVAVVATKYARRTTVAAEASAKAAKESATAGTASARAAEASARAAEVSAKTYKDLLAIEQDRRYNEMRPKLRGRLVQAPGESDPINAWLEVHLDTSTPAPLRSMLLTVPAGAWFARGIGQFPVLMQNDFGFPEVGWQKPPIRPGRPARWRVHRSNDAHGTLTATARCTREDGLVWEDVEVPISQDSEE